ncbi:MAG: hypothetical protein EON93_01745 [Burkholderiales bacterium]|nr:MAG: hypothetical protein EON93_01745 [Burkholderiales bacterium]
MTARQEILGGKFSSTPGGIAAKRAAGGSGQMADLFAGFVGYASANGSYAAQPGGQAASALLAGSGPATAACGTIREALKKLVLREDLLLKDVQNADINGYFLTKPQLSCFDPKVKGCRQPRFPQP